VGLSPEILFSFLGSGLSHQVHSFSCSTRAYGILLLADGFLREQDGDSQAHPPYLDILEIFSEGMLKVVMHFQSDRMLPFTVVDELAYTEVSQKIVFL
jgi:hypothetical protein